MTPKELAIIAAKALDEKKGKEIAGVFDEGSCVFIPWPVSKSAKEFAVIEGCPVRSPGASGMPYYRSEDSQKRVFVRKWNDQLQVCFEKRIV